MVKKGYYGNEGLGLAWNQIGVRKVALYSTTEKGKSYVLFLNVEF